jgi:bifunctional DNA-binding transcriptional regulator/antitoxin component of YhaV-PrlF toxin-antitoxin module
MRRSRTKTVETAENIRIHGGAGSRAAARSSAVLRKRSQITLPADLIDQLGLEEGDTILIDAYEGYAIVRPVRHSYAGRYAGVYGAGYLEAERSSWD